MQEKDRLHAQEDGPGPYKKNCISTPASSDSSEACLRDGKVYHILTCSEASIKQVLPRSLAN